MRRRGGDYLTALDPETGNRWRLRAPSSAGSSAQAPVLAFALTIWDAPPMTELVGRPGLPAARPWARIRLLPVQRAVIRRGPEGMGVAVGRPTMIAPELREGERSFPHRNKVPQRRVEQEAEGVERDGRGPKGQPAVVAAKDLVHGLGRGTG